MRQYNEQTNFYCFRTIWLSAMEFPKKRNSQSGGFEIINFTFIHLYL
jgi:hypothetical protein